MIHLMFKTAIGYSRVLACFLPLLLPSFGYSDFIVNNSLVEVGVVAGDNSDGFGAHGLADLFLSVTDGVPGTADFQQADALFVLAVEENTALGDYELIYDSQVLATTGGIGNASSLANGIIVFSLTEQFEVTSHLGESILNDSMGEAIVFDQDVPLLLSAGTYSLSFGSSAFIHDGDPIFEITDSQTGLLSFNAASVPEPTTTYGFLILYGISMRRVRRS